MHPDQDPQVFSAAREHLGGLFTGLGQARQSGGDTGLIGGLNLAEEFAEFLQMPLELAQLFAEMGFDIADMVLKSLAEAGYILVKGLTPMA